MSATNVIEPRAVESTATVVSHGLQILATAVRMDESRACSSFSSSSEVIFRKMPNDNEAAPNQSDNCFLWGERRSNCVAG